MEGKEDNGNEVLSGDLVQPKNPMDVYLVVKNVLRNLEVGDLLRCWSVNSLFRDVAKPLIQEKKRTMELRLVNQVVKLIKRFQQDEIQPTPHPLFPPKKYDIQIRKNDNEFASLVNDLWRGYGGVATHIHMNFDTNGRLDRMPRPGNNEEGTILSLTTILEHCTNLETLSVYLPSDIFIPQALADELPKAYPSLKRIRVKSPLSTEQGLWNDVDLIGFLIEKSPCLEKLQLTMGHPLVSAGQAVDINRILPERLGRVGDRTTVELCLTLSFFDEAVLRELRALPPRVTDLNVAVISNENLEWTPGASLALSQWISSLCPTLQTLKLAANWTGDFMNWTSLEHLRELEISHSENDAGVSHAFTPGNFPKLERLCLNSIDRDWIFQDGFTRVHELSLGYDADDSPCPLTPISWNLTFPSVSSLKIHLWTSGSKKGLLDQVASLLDGFPNILQLELSNAWTLGNGKEAFKLLTGQKEKHFGGDDSDWSSDEEDEEKEEKGALVNLKKLKTLRLVEPTVSTARALILASVKGGMRRLEKITFIQWDVAYLYFFRQRLEEFHRKVECVLPSSLQTDAGDI